MKETSLPSPSLSSGSALKTSDVVYGCDDLFRVMPRVVGSMTRVMGSGIRNITIAIAIFAFIGSSCSKIQDSYERKMTHRIYMQAPLVGERLTFYKAENGVYPESVEVIYSEMIDPPGGLIHWVYLRKKDGSGYMIVSPYKVNGNFIAFDQDRERYFLEKLPDKE